MIWREHRRPPLFACLLSAALNGCTPAANDPATAETPPLEVSIAAVESATVPRTLDLPGRLVSTRVAEVRAQVAGIIQERTFEEGSLVRRGDVLFRIDPAVYRAEVDARTAALARAEATRVQALKQSERTETLLERQAASTAQHDIAVATLRQAEADVASAKAQLARARIDLDYATVRAPIAGRIGRALVTEGALVSQSEATRLALIQQVDPIFADFNAAASDTSLLADRAAGRESAEVRLVLPDGSLHADAGGSCSPMSVSIPAPGRSACAPPSRTRTSPCCRAPMSACGSHWGCCPAR